MERARALFDPRRYVEQLMTCYDRACRAKAAEV